MSKKIIALCLALVMVLSMTACSAPAQTAEPEQTAEPATKASTAETPTADALPVIGSAIQYDPNVPINDGKDIEVELWFRCSKSVPVSGGSVHCNSPQRDHHSRRESLG